MRPLARRLAGAGLQAALLLLGAGAAPAQTVTLQGVMGGRALLVVDGGTPRMLAAGDRHAGVRLVSVAGDQAVVEVDGQRQTLRLGDAPGHMGQPPAAGQGRRIVLTADAAGHFLGQGQVNGRPAQFLVDTGASAVAIGSTDAERLGLNYRAGVPVRMATANGPAPAWRLRLNSVRVGDVELFDVDAVVTSQPMPFVLLGNSFLNRFQMQRNADQLTLERHD